MTIPKQNQFNQSVLEIAVEDGGILTYKQLIALLTKRFSLTEDDLQELISDGRQTVVYNSTVWAAGDLKRAGLLDSPRAGRFQINANGRSYLRTQGNTSTSRLRKLRAALEIHQNDTEEPRASDLIIGIDDLEVGEETDTNPDDQIAEAAREIEVKLKDDLLSALKGLSGRPNHFEQIVVDLLKAMGYGEGRRIGQSGDGGVDGVIFQDVLELGLENQIYIQAKCWNDASVTSQHVQGFSGSLGSKKASKGVFITTSRFTKDAKQAAENALRDNKVIRLIDGQELAGLMIQYNVGVVHGITYVVKILNENYFVEEN